MIDQSVFRPMLYGVVMWGVAIYAFRRGGRDERLAATALVIASYLTAVAVSPSEHHYRQVESGIALVDAVLFLVLQFIALRSTKFWPLWISAIQGVTVIGHFAPLMPHMPTSIARDAVALWAWPQWIILAFAVHRHRRQALRPEAEPERGRN
jgi:hypothetical protein